MALTKKNKNGTYSVDYLGAVWEGIKNSPRDILRGGSLSPNYIGNQVSQKAANDFVKSADPFSGLRSNVQKEKDTLKQIDSYKKGGIVKKTGLAKLHKGEMVIPADKVAEFHANRGRDFWNKATGGRMA